MTNSLIGTIFFGVLGVMMDEWYEKKHLGRDNPYNTFGGWWMLIIIVALVFHEKKALR